jgi:hypothetical protein
VIEQIWYVMHWFPPFLVLTKGSIQIDGFGSCELFLDVLATHDERLSDPEDLQLSPIFRT